MVRQVDRRRGVLLVVAFLFMYGVIVALDNVWLSAALFAAWALGVFFGKYEQ